MHPVERISVALRRRHPVVVDVHNEDYELLGHIKDAEHLPSGKFKDDDVGVVVAKFGSKQNIVFHCGPEDLRATFHRACTGGWCQAACLCACPGFNDFAEIVVQVFSSYFADQKYAIS
ncbi:hypothetical protein GN244_ATG01619 [Phytophthora infestans]|uniref:Uncharacterized protein n=1 Tax=Phytophthora infestans TaxID=4787 RepID=A0A833WMT7_PHYIN|nr:hypothetical protein GN244_ATG01619 [Phytophthora infestans]